MKVLILNGSPRPLGDTAFILNRLKACFPPNTEVETMNLFETAIQPCNDCRACWEQEGCAIRDGMDLLWQDDYSILILASPLYMSSLTPPLFSVISRLNAVWCNQHFLNIPNRLRPKKGLLVLAGGGDGSPGPAIRMAKTAFHFLNADFDPERDLICSLSTNSIPARDDPNLAEQISAALQHIMETI